MSDQAPSSKRTAVHTGGCQCGRIRYSLHTEPSHASICHCRMCQKAFGNYFAPFATVKTADLSWTTGTLATFRSSDLVERGFCRDCGTPLSFRFTDRETISVSVGSLDDPSRIKPAVNIGVEGRAHWLGEMLQSDGTTTEARVPAERLAKLASRQHRDGV